MKKSLFAAAVLCGLVLAPAAANATTRYTYDPGTGCTTVKVTEVVNGKVVLVSSKTTCPYKPGF